MKNESYNNEMDWLDDLLTESSDEETFIESLFDDEDYILEKASSMEYNIRRFKQQYKFDPKTSTIEVDGKRYKVDMNIHQAMLQTKDPTYGIPVSEPRLIGANITSNDDPKIVLTQDFFRLKDDSRRAAILQHEIGHTKLHSFVPGYKYTDTSKISKKMIMDEINRQLKEIEKAYMKSRMSASDIEDSIKMTRGYLVDNIDQKYLKTSTATKLESEIRADARTAAHKALPKHNPQGASTSHLNVQELEADRYAANRTSEKAVKRGLRESFKQARKSADKNLSLQGKATYMNTHEVPAEQRKTMKVSKPERIRAITTDLNGKQVTTTDKIKKNISKAMDYEYKARSKALKDKDLRNAKALK